MHANTLTHSHTHTPPLLLCVENRSMLGESKHDNSDADNAEAGDDDDDDDEVIRLLIMVR